MPERGKHVRVHAPKWKEVIHRLDCGDGVGAEGGVGEGCLEMYGRQPSSE